MGTQQEPTNNDNDSKDTTKNSKQWIQTIMWKDLSSNDVTVVSGTMDELRNVIDAEVENREYLTRSGGVMTIMGVMEGRIESESVQFMGCTILERLASTDSETNEAIREMGGISMIRESMRQHSVSERVQRMGHAALATISKGKSW